QRGSSMQQIAAGVTEESSPDQAQLNGEGLVTADRRKSWFRNSKLAYACFGLFALFLAAQSVTGWRTYDADQVEHGQTSVSYGRYLTTGHFAEATFEN